MSNPDHEFLLIIDTGMSYQAWPEAIGSRRARRLAGEIATPIEVSFLFAAALMLPADRRPRYPGIARIIHRWQISQCP
jgi:hypothetical protein